MVGLSAVGVGSDEERIEVEVVVVDLVVVVDRSAVEEVERGDIVNDGEGARLVSEISSECPDVADSPQRNSTPLLTKTRPIKSSGTALVPAHALLISNWTA